MVRYYKEELEESGINIESFKGPNGGYFLLKTNNPYNQFNKYDIELLIRVYSELKKFNFEFIDDFEKLIKKTQKIEKIENEKAKYIIDIKNCDNDKVKLIESHIKMNAKIKIIYEDLNGNTQIRVIHPIYLFLYDNKYYVTAFCELRNSIRHFEINRIKEIIENEKDEILPI
jgi:predicted DNA-binding transcriptional regulator YafY